MNNETKYTADPTLLLTAQEAATYLRIPLGSLYVHIHKKRIPCTRLGRLLRFRRVELDSMMTRSQAPVSAEQNGQAVPTEASPASETAIGQGAQMLPPESLQALEGAAEASPEKAK
jgi:excisionase family DNA binding protein